MWRVVSTRTVGDVTTVEVVGTTRRSPVERATFLLPFDSWIPISAGRPLVVRPRRWRRLARSALAALTPHWWSLRAAAQARIDVYPYQLAPALALVRGQSCRFLIADAVGLGKTIQAGLMIAETIVRRPGARALVVCPAGLRDQWREELHERFAIRGQLLDAGTIARLSADLPPYVNPWAIHDVIITSVDYVKRPEVLQCLESLVWDIAVFDEAHGLTTRSGRSDAAAILARRSRAVVLLTATPHSGEPESFERLAALGQLYEDGILVFRRTRSARSAAAPRSRLCRVALTVEERQMHEALITYARLVWAQPRSPAGARLVIALLLRRAASSPASLVRSVARRLELLEPGRAAVQPALPYDDTDVAPDEQLGAPALRNVGLERQLLESLLTHARKATNTESKLRALRRLLCRVSDPVIVFTEYRDTLDHLASSIGRAGTLLLHGGLTQRERKEVVRKFTSGDSTLLLSTDTGAEGLNLHHRCRMVINMEVPWMPRRLEQRGGRVDRIGQKQRVHLLTLLAAGTGEEEVLARLLRRELRAQDTLRPLTHHNEIDVAASIVTGLCPDECESSDPLPSWVIPAGASEAEDLEAHRISLTRTLLTDSALVPDVVVLCGMKRSGRHGGPARRFWLFHCACLSGTNEPMWDAAVGVVAPAEIGRSHRTIRKVLDPAAVSRHPLVTRFRHDLARALEQSLQPASHTWRTRERAILAEARQHLGKLSATAVQPGLFDRRVERLQARRRAGLDEIEGHSSARLSDIDAMSSITAAEPKCAFGLLRD